ncbi:MAG: TetR family transcriptional regulator [Streptosporangiales bacterium]|nr:TetR family transcriptional regulator [Streptosporangiales bacterium]
MPTGFTEQERVRIDKALRDTGFQLFTTQGLKKTSLDELVTPAGIAKSSFYAFFDSREALYIELMYEQVPELNRWLLDELYDESAGTTEAVRAFMHGVLDIQRNNPLYSRLMSHSDELAMVARRVSPEQLLETKRYLVSPIVEFIERAQRAGRLIDGDPGVLLGVIQAVMVIPLEKDRLDPETYPAALELLVDIVANGLTRPAADGTQPTGEDRTQP